MMVFGPDDVRLMRTVLDASWNALRFSDNVLARPEYASATRLLLAKRILHHASSKDADYRHLLTVVLSGLIDDAAAHRQSAAE
jgi:hypothetical protein